MTVGIVGGEGRGQYDVRGGNAGAVLDITVEEASGLTALAHDLISLMRLHHRLLPRRRRYALSNANPLVCS